MATLHARNARDRSESARAAVAPLARADLRHYASPAMSHPASGQPSAPSELELAERGAPRDGTPQRCDERLFIEFFALECARSPGTAAVAEQLTRGLRERGLGGAIYADVHHPLGLGIAAFSEEPTRLAVELRSLLADPSLPDSVRIRPEFTLLGRTYSSGYEPDLRDWLLARPRRTLTNPEWPWAIWYPLKRASGFERLEARERGGILAEHGAIGRQYGEADLAHDVRLSSHGLDTHDNDFVIGLVGRELYPLSHVVQSMRRTRQTAEHMQHMGPFFIGRVLAQVTDG